MNIEQIIYHHLNTDGKVIRRPSKPAHKSRVLDYLADKIPAGSYSESDINDILTQRHTFGDVALLCRELYINHLIDRTLDDRKYSKLA